MTDDFDEMPSPDEESDDFRNFDPDSYLRKRGRATGVSPSGDDLAEQQHQDFDKFDPDAYLRKRRAARGKQPITTDTYQTGEDVPPRSRRRRRSVADDDEPIPDVGTAAGLGAGLFGLFTSGETARLDVEILRSASPLVKAGLLALGCAILVVLGAICALGFLLATAISRR